LIARFVPGHHPNFKAHGRDVIRSSAVASTSTHGSMIVSCTHPLRTFILLAYTTSSSLIVTYSDHPVKLHTTYPPTLRKIQNMVESELGVTFNHVLLNRYEDGSIYIGKHSDGKENRVRRHPLSSAFGRIYQFSRDKGYCLRKLGCGQGFYDVSQSHEQRSLDKAVGPSQWQSFCNAGGHSEELEGAFVP
jgi:hypothetical protein